MNSSVRHLLDAFFAVCALLGIVISSVIPLLAALASLTWYSIRVYEWWKERKKNGNVGTN